MQRYFSNIKNDDKFILNSDDLYHIKTVMRMRDGDKIEVVYEKQVYLCCIQYVNNDIEVSILKVEENKNNKEPYVSLILPFLTEQKLDLILQKSTELGVNEIILTDFERSKIKLDEKKKENKLNRWGKIVKEAAEQSMRIDIPIIKIMSKKDIYNLDGLKIICSTLEKEKTIKNVLKKEINYVKILIVVGPEGGISPSEEEEYYENGFIKITLGHQILRVETVPIFILSNIRYEFME